MKKSKKKKYQDGGTEPAAIDTQMIDYTDYLTPASTAVLDYYKNGGVVDYMQSGGGELDGNAVMPYVSFKGDYHNDPSGSRGIALGLEGGNPRKVQNEETRAFVPTDKLMQITGMGQAMLQMGGPEAMGMPAPPQQQGMPVQNAPQPPVGQPEEESKVVLGDMVEPESKKEYQELANELKKIAKNDPNNTRVQDEIKEKMAELALKQEAQRVMEEQFPDGPPQVAPPEQAQALNENMAMMQMLQGQGAPMQQPQMQQAPTPEQSMDPEAIPLAQEGMAFEGSGDIDPYADEYLTEEFMQTYNPEMYANIPYNINRARLDSSRVPTVGALDMIRGLIPPYEGSQLQTLPPMENIPYDSDATYDDIMGIDRDDFAKWKARTSKEMNKEEAKENRLAEKDAGSKDKNRDGKPDYLGMATLAGASLASNMGNIMYLAEQGKRSEQVNPERYTVDPELISLDQQRKDIETRMNRVAYENRMSGQGDISRATFLAGQELQAMAPTYEKEENVNAQIINQADQFNAQMRMNADDINAQNRAAALKQYYDSISQIGQNINTLAMDINQRRENKEMYNLLDGYFPHYSYTRGEGWTFTG